MALEILTGQTSKAFLKMLIADAPNGNGTNYQLKNPFHAKSGYHKIANGPNWVAWDNTCGECWIADFVEGKSDENETAAMRWANMDVETVEEAYQMF